MCDTERINQAVQAFKAGKSPDDNFQFIYECYYRRVFNFLVRRNFARDICPDLTQIVFLHVYTGMAQFRGDAEFTGWVFQIAARVGIDDLRSSKTQKRTGYHLSLDSGGDNDESNSWQHELPDRSSKFQPEEAALDEEQRQLLYEAMMELPEQMRKCMIFRVYQELSYEEIAVAMGLSVETVKAHLHQGRKKLKAALSPYYGEQGGK